MKQLVNKNLISLKCVLFCFLAGVGCLFPFLPLHLLSVGLDKGEARLISAVAPCVALLGPAILGPLIDKLSVGRGSTTGGPGGGPSGSGKLLRVTLALCMILSAVFYLLLLAVPYTERHEARRPRVLFFCDSNGAYVMQEVCTEGMRCKRWDGDKTGVLAVSSCEYGCADENMTWLTEPFPTTTTTTTISPLFDNPDNETAAALTRDENDDVDDIEEYPPHICTGGQCQVYLKQAGRLIVPLSLLAPTTPDDNTTDDYNQDWCTYTTASPSKCMVPPSRLSVPAGGQCRPAIRCQVLDPYDVPDGVLADAQCRLVIGNPQATFWTYLIIRMLSDIWPMSCLALLGAACVVATRETSRGRGDVGRQLAVGTIGLALGPPLAGLAAQLEPQQPYLAPFVLHAVFMIVGALILLIDSGMPVSPPEWWWHTCAGAVALPLNSIRRYGAETAAIFTVLTLLGTLFSIIDTYIPWKLVDLHGTDTVVGLSVTIGALPAVPLLWWAETVVDYIGHSNVFIAAFTLYSLRFLVLGSSTDDYTWVLACEALEVFTLSLVWITAVLYFRHLVPRKYTATGQALPVIAHFCLGGCIGAIVGGLVGDVYAGAGVAALVAGLLYLGVYHVLVAPRCHAPAQPPPLLQGLNGNGTNGAYSPMRVYHEERARKGQFRY